MTRPTAEINVRVVRDACAEYLRRRNERIEALRQQGFIVEEEFE